MHLSNIKQPLQSTNLINQANSINQSDLRVPTPSTISYIRCSHSKSLATWLHHLIARYQPTGNTLGAPECPLRWFKLANPKLANLASSVPSQRNHKKNSCPQFPLFLCLLTSVISQWALHHPCLSQSLTITNCPFSGSHPLKAGLPHLTIKPVFLNNDLRAQSPPAFRAVLTR